MDFEWDTKKALENIRKHDGITFEEASLAFFDEWANMMTRNPNNGLF